MRNTTPSNQGEAVVLKEQSILSSLFRSFSYLLFSNSRIVGALLLGLSFLNPSAGVHAVVAFGAATLFGKLTGTAREEITSGLELYNSTLVGLALRFVFNISLLSLGLA